jgi:hypothetical protein
MNRADRCAESEDVIDTEVRIFAKLTAAIESLSLFGEASFVGMKLHPRLVAPIQAIEPEPKPGEKCEEEKEIFCARSQPLNFNRFAAQDFFEPFHR